jgi:cytochrome P450
MFNPRDPVFLTDPYPAYRQLRATAPVWKAPFGRWLISGYEDCDHVLRDRRMGKDYTDPAALMNRFGPTALSEPSVVELSHMMLMRDPPDHTRLRGLITKAFTGRNIARLRGNIAAIADNLLDRVAADGGMDAMRDLAYPLPVLVICELLGIPEHDRAGFAANPSFNGGLLNLVPPTREELDSANANTAERGAYFDGLFEQRRREPRDDLITLLVQAEEAGDRLTPEELRANVMLLFAAGHETTVNLIGNGLLALLRHPEQWRALRDDPTLIPNAIEELLRYDSPVQASLRIMLEPADIGGVALAKGESVVTLIGAANRDPAVFTEPDRLDIARQQRRPLSFGAGIHFCIGAQLARMEAEVVLETLLRRLPALRLSSRAEPEWRLNFILRGLTALPVEW